MTVAVAWLEQVPAAVQSVFEDFRTAELATIGRDGTPLAWPIVTAFRSGTGHFLTTASIGFPDKAFRIRRNPKVSLLFSEPTGSGLDSPPAVHVVGDAECPDTIRTEVTGFESDVRRMYGFQPKARFYGADPLTRRLLDWYFIRLVIELKPRQIKWWPQGDFAQDPIEIRCDT